MLHLHNEPVCLDDRMVGTAGTGVTSFAGAMRRLLPQLTERPMLLSAGTAQRGRLARLLAAARRGVRPAHVAADDGAIVRIVADDVFREAQVHFDLYRRLLAVRGLPPRSIMHWTYPVPLRMSDAINIYTVHDTIPLTHPDLTPIAERRHRRLLDRIVAAADRIVTVSEAARDDIVAATGCSPALVENVGQPVTLAGTSAPLPEGIVAGRFFLVCGTIEPRKNLGRVLEAHRASGTTMPLLLVGPDGWRSAPILRQIAANGGARRLPWQPRETVEALIASARALLMPSLAEGFGLPVAEAMACGTPVLTSASGALAETAGDAALTVDPYDVSAMSDALRRLSNDDALCAALADAGRRRAAAFAPDRIAVRLRRLYGELVATRDGTAYPATPTSQGETI